MAKGYGMKWYGKKVFTLATKANIEAMKLATKVVEADVKKNFTLQGTGKARRRTKDGKVHRASKPKQPPAIDTGTLRASIMSEVKIEGMSVNGRVGPDIKYIANELAKRESVGTDVNYGYYLEVGAPKINLAPRPFLVPALKRQRRKILRIFQAANK